MTRGTIIRTICLLLALVNQVLVMFGRSPLPIEDEVIEMAVSTIWTIASAAWAWWKNNSITPEAIASDRMMHEMKRNRGSDGDGLHEF